MASLIFGYIASMATILVVLMVLLNNYLQPSYPTALQQQPPPLIGRDAASEHQTRPLPATRSTDGSPSSEVQTLATNVELSKGPESARAPLRDSGNAQTPVTAEAAPAAPDSGEIPVAAPADAKTIKPQKLVSHHSVRRHYERPYHSALGFKPEAPYRQTYGPFSRGGANGW
jgi:hypothetical protein